MRGRLAGRGGRTEISGKGRHHRWPIRNFTECHIQRYLPAQPGMNLRWGPDATNWRGILWLPPKEENKFFVTTWLFSPSKWKVLTLSNSHTSFSQQKPMSTYRKFFRKILEHLFYQFWLSAQQATLGTILADVWEDRWWHSVDETQ